MVSGRVNKQSASHSLRCPFHLGGENIYNQKTLVAWQECSANLHGKGSLELTVKVITLKLCAQIRFAKGKYKIMPFGLKKKKKLFKYSLRKPERLVSLNSMCQPDPPSAVPL